MKRLACVMILLLAGCTNDNMARLDHLARQCATGNSEASCMLFEVELQRQEMAFQRRALAIRTLQGMSARYSGHSQPTYSECGGWLVCPEDRF